MSLRCRSSTLTPTKPPAGMSNTNVTSSLSRVDGKNCGNRDSEQVRLTSIATQTIDSRGSELTASNAGYYRGWRLHILVLVLFMSITMGCQNEQFIDGSNGSIDTGGITLSLNMTVNADEGNKAILSSSDLNCLDTVHKPNQAKRR